MDITCDMCGKPCRGQGTQGRGETNALPHPPLPHDQPHPLYLTGTPASSPHSVRSAHIRQTARNPRVRHAARPPPGTPASHPHHSCAQNADHLAQNTPNSLNFTEVVCTLGASIPNTANMETAARPTGIAAVSVGGGAWPNIGNGAPIRINHHNPTGMEGPWAAEEPGRTTSRRAEPRTAIQRRRCGGRRRVRRARAGFEARRRTQ